jgi:lipopolysaccharide biosynthesis glycosyltransferase
MQRLQLRASRQFDDRQGFEACTKTIEATKSSCIAPVNPPARSHKSLSLNPADEKVPTRRTVGAILDAPMMRNDKDPGSLTRATRADPDNVLDSASRKVTVAYCVDRNMLHPCLVSIYSLLRHLGRSVLDLHIALETVPQSWAERVRQVLALVSANSSVTFHQISLKEFQNYPGLHGNHMTYARLLLPNLIDSPRIAYIDADTLVLVDPASLTAEPLDGNPLGAVAWNNTVAQAQARDLYREVGFADTDLIFNGGVLVVDRAAWRSLGLAHHATPPPSLSRLNGRLTNMLTCDPLLNVIVDRRFRALPWRYNVRFGSAMNIDGFSGVGIVHFVGKLKPWSRFGRWRHNGYTLWRNWERQISRLPLSQ